MSSRAFRQISQVDEVLMKVVRAADSSGKKTSKWVWSSNTVKVQFIKRSRMNFHTYVFKLSSLHLTWKVLIM